MKKLLLVVIFILIVTDISAQANDWIWAEGAGDISNDYSNAVCTDASGNVYATGTFQASSITFGNYTLYNAGTGHLDIFVVKYDASGNVLWAKSGGGTGDDYAYGICADANENVFITGFFRPPSLTLGTITLTNADSTGFNFDIFTAKYDSAGNLLWAKSEPNPGSELCYGICTDSNGDVYITGAFGYQTNFIFGNYTLITRGYYDLFIAKYDSDGNVLWAKNAGGTQADGGQAICADASGNVYVTGYFQYQAIFGSDTIHGNGNVNVFLAKYDTHGNNLWAKSATGPAYSIGIGYGITADQGGKVYITGYFAYSVIFGSDTLGNSGYSIFTAKYDTSGNALWGRSPGGTNLDYGTSISADAYGNVFVTGYFASSFLNFGGIPVLNANVGYNDIFVAEYDGSGNALWATGVGGPDYDYGMGICASTSGDVYVTGYFGSYSVNFGNITLINNGSYDIFLAKLGSYTGIEENYSQASCSVFPNPSTGQFTVYSSSLKVGCTMAIYNVTGEKIYSQNISNYNNNQMPINLKLNKGVYFIQLINGQQTITKQIVVE
ncbi:MAG TPA: T9SS type A sorting domain-containing protein [Chitinophagales bacterium]|nr:T9SS type A sorting domain-containing protein [Chitinophagales bacterium]